MKLREQIDAMLASLAEADHLDRPPGVFLGGEDERRLGLDLQTGHAALRTAHRHALRARGALDAGDADTASLWLEQAEACLIGKPIADLKAAPTYGASRLDRDVELWTLTKELLEATGQTGKRGAEVKTAKIVLARNSRLARKHPDTRYQTIWRSLANGKRGPNI